MQKPCLDSYSTQFLDIAHMLDYHERLHEASRWERCNVSSLCVKPLDKGSPLLSDMSAFAPFVTQEAIQDTAEQMGLALNSTAGLIPVRNTAGKSLMDRAKISGSVLWKLDKAKLAGILNDCMQVHKSSEALVLIRDEKVSAVHSGDKHDYSILHAHELIHALKNELDSRFPGNVFLSGYADHTLTTATWALPAQQKQLLGSYEKALAAHGYAHLASDMMPGIRFSTSDVGFAAASVSAIITSKQGSIRIGNVVTVEHRRQSLVSDFASALSQIYARYADVAKCLERLLDVILVHPVNAMTSVCKRLALPKKASLEAIAMFEMAVGNNPATAHDIYMAMQEIQYILRTSGAPESKLASIEESVCRALTLRWEDHDLAKAVSF